MLKKNAIAAPNRCLTVSPWVPGKAEAGSVIKEVVFHAARGHPIYAAQYQSIRKAGIQAVQIQGNGLWALPLVVQKNPRAGIDPQLARKSETVCRSNEVKGPQIFLVVGTK